MARKINKQAAGTKSPATRKTKLPAAPPLNGRFSRREGTARQQAADSSAKPGSK